MTLDNDITQQARGLLEIGQKRMVNAYPFHASFISRWKIYPSNLVETVGITLRGANILFLFNPQFIVNCSLAEIMGLLHHEVNHLLFEHLLIDPEKFENKEALIIAEEVTVNEWIKEPLPGNPLLLANFPQLAENEDTFTRYKRLSSGKKIKQSKLQKEQKVKKDVLNLGIFVPNFKPSVQNLPQNVPNSGKNALNFKPIKPLDDHNIWQEVRDAGLLGAMAIKVTVKETVENLSSQQIAKVPYKTREAITAMCGKGTDCLFEEISSENNNNGQINWQELLHKYVREAVETYPSFTKAPRRFPELLGIVPSWQYRPSKAVVMAVIDTSGSISSEVLDLIAKEIEIMSHYYQVTIVECDCQIQRIYQFAGSIKGVIGRGGTDLRPPFAPSIISTIRPHVICYFTDGYGQTPEFSPSLPVVWCITENGQRPTFWGFHLQIR
jgi:predicted metal-dependent peptidase